MAQRTKKPGAARIRSAAFRRIRADHQSELAEDYVELIADLIDEKGEARGSDVALRLGVANATVVKTLKRLQDAGLVTQEPYRSIFLTGDGWKMAEDGRRKHKIVESFLLALGVTRKRPGSIPKASSTTSARRHCGRWRGFWRGRWARRGTPCRLVP